MVVIVIAMVALLMVDDDVPISLMVLGRVLTIECAHLVLLVMILLMVIIILVVMVLLVTSNDGIVGYSNDG